MTRHESYEEIKESGIRMAVVKSIALYNTEAWTIMEADINAS